MVFDRPIKIEKLDETTDEWSEVLSLHARVNKTSGGEYNRAGASRSVNTLTFEVRYNANLKDIRLNTQVYRLIYDNQRYNIVDYDDYLEKHQTIKLVGESY